MSTPNSSKEHLGVGWRFPVAPQQGRLVYAQHEDDIEQAIQIILQTSQGERAMLPEFGAGLNDFVFEPNSVDTHGSIENAVRQALIDWEPRIDLERVEVVANDNEPNVLLIHIDYVVRSTNTFYNRVYPFYLLEGGA